MNPSRLPLPPPPSSHPALARRGLLFEPNALPDPVLRGMVGPSVSSSNTNRTDPWHLGRIDRIHQRLQARQHVEQRPTQRHPPPTHDPRHHRPPHPRRCAPNSCNRPCSGGVTARPKPLDLRPDQLMVITAANSDARPTPSARPPRLTRPARARRRRSTTRVLGLHQIELQRAGRVDGPAAEHLAGVGHADPAGPQPPVDPLGAVAGRTRALVDLVAAGCTGRLEAELASTAARPTPTRTATARTP